MHAGGRWHDTLTSNACMQVADGMTPSHPHQFAYCSLEVADLPSVDLVAQFTTCFDFIDQALNTQGEGCAHSSHVVLIVINIISISITILRCQFHGMFMQVAVPLRCLRFATDMGQCHI